MVKAHVLWLLAASVLLSACESTRWVHPTKKEEQLTYDWNACERELQNMAATNPGVASMHTNQTIQKQRIGACLQKKGWREVEIK
ncbi:MAG: hypothetical protein AB7G48_14210 [Nitrospiraceae bacterium]